MINSYVALDLETTGLNPSTDRIIEIGAVKVINGIIVSTYSTLVNPQIPINFKINKLTGIDSQMLINQPLIGDIIDDFVKYTQDLPILGHNVIFDFSFLKKAAVNNKLTFEKEGIDTLKMARRMLPHVEHKGLEYLCNYFNINPENSHRAMDDAISAMKIYEKLYELNRKDKGFLETVKLNYSAKRDTSITPAQTSYLTRLVIHHSIIMQSEINGLTKSQASRMIDNIISEYGKILS